MKRFQIRKNYFMSIGASFFSFFFLSCFNAIRSDSPFQASVVLSITVYSFSRQSALVLTLNLLARFFVYSKGKLKDYRKAEIGATMAFIAAYKCIMKGSFFFSCILKAYILRSFASFSS